MSAANASAVPPSIQEEMRAHEPSMEEILASIRRIIADDEALPGVRREIEERRRREAQAAPEAAPAPQEVSAEGSAEALSATETAQKVAVVAEIRQLRLNRAPDPAAHDETGDDEACAEDSHDSTAGELAGPEPEAPEHDRQEGSLISENAASSVASHFQALAASVIINDSGMLQKCAVEIMRPLLKEWLDDNLPVIVERLVRAEIERVARGRR